MKKTVVEEGSSIIRLNQIGYYPKAIKEFIVADMKADNFEVVDEENNVVFEGDLMALGQWEASGEQVLLGDFSEIRDPGTYKIMINDSLVSWPFEINQDIYRGAFNAAIKSFYFQRASMTIEEQYGGKFQRAAGHFDMACTYHPSSGKTGGTLDSPGGWYDAGDYNKYIVNAAVSAGQMLNLIELFPEIVSDGQLNIPESGNGISDLLDEVKYELDWMLTMQDSDGGVYHKLTGKNFSAFIMPEAYDLERFVVGKGTASTLDFAAVMAQASRIFATTDQQYSDDLLRRSQTAWDWSVVNDSIPFRNPNDVVTGEYGDSDFSDDFYWAAAELYISTGSVKYLEYLNKYKQPVMHRITNSWKFFVRNMGFHSLLANKDQVDPNFITPLIEEYLKLSDDIIVKQDMIPYHIGIDHFEWGSNSDVLNQAMILCYAHLLSGKEKYLHGVERDVDYIFGKNATGYCFLTGFGSKPAMHPHHRPSEADGIEDPIPGFIVGGPNMHKQDRQSTTYSSDYPAKSYADVQPSYASNEVCLNWNAPAVFALGYLERIN